MKTILITLLCMTIITLSATPESDLSTTNYLLEEILAHSYGANNPLLELTQTVDLTLDAYAARPTHELAAIIARMQIASAQTTQALMQQAYAAPHLQALAQSCEDAHTYLSTQSDIQVRNLPTVKRHKKRFLGTIMGIGLFGGAFKYVIIALLGVAALGVMWKISRIMTRETREAIEAAGQAEKRTHDELVEYAKNANNLLQLAEKDETGRKPHKSAKHLTGLTGGFLRIKNWFKKKAAKTPDFKKKAASYLRCYPATGLSSDQTRVRETIVRLCVLLNVDPLPVLKRYPRTSK